MVETGCRELMETEAGRVVLKEEDRGGQRGLPEPNYLLKIHSNGEGCRSTKDERHRTAKRRILKDGVSLLSHHTLYQAC